MARKVPTVPNYHRNCILSCGVLFVIILVSSCAMWALTSWSTAANTQSIQAPKNSITHPFPMAANPNHWAQLWSQPTEDEAIVAGGVVITRTGKSVVGHDPATGSILWHYTRNTPICGMRSLEDNVIISYRDHRGCGEFVELDPTDGSRFAARSSAMNPTATLQSHGNYLLQYDSKRVNVLREGLGLVIHYGYEDTPVEPKAQPRQGCTILSASFTMNGFGVIENCLGEEFNRLTILDTKPAKEQTTNPHQIQSRILPILGTDPHEYLLSVKNNTAYIAKINTDQRTMDYVTVGKDNDGTSISIPASAAELPGSGKDLHYATSLPNTETLWSYYFGGKTLIIDPATGKITTTITGTRGPGVDIADSLFIPGAGKEYIFSNGTVQSTPMNRNASCAADSPISSDTDNSFLVETCNGTLTVWKPIT